MSEDIGDNDDEKDKSFKEELARRHRRKVLLRIGTYNAHGVYSTDVIIIYYRL